VLVRCLNRVFEIFPATRTDKLEDEGRTDAEAYLHAFVVNAIGAIDNMSMAIAHYHGLVGGASELIDKRDVSFANRKFRKLLSQNLRSELESLSIAAWHSEYAKGYRDGLVHRIPPYIPPAAMNNQEAAKQRELDEKIGTLTSEEVWTRFPELIEEMRSLGIACPLIGHSFRDSSPQVYIHPQLLKDYSVIEDLLKVTMDNFDSAVAE
jgi:hypothetical protein